MKPLSFALLSLALAACATSDDTDSSAACSGGKCDAPVDQTCSDPHYGDGMCQTDLTCGVPDIDCFKTFTDDAAGATWFAAFEQTLAHEEGRAPRRVLGESDPRFQKTRALLDRGWAAFRASRPVGELGNLRPALVVIDDPTKNAFVIPDIATDTSAFAVMVDTGLPIDDEAAALGVMMHELQHAVGLHLIHGNKLKMRRYYFASSTVEPIGRTMMEDATAREAGVVFSAISDDIGLFDNAELGGLPIGGGQMATLFNALLDGARQQNPAACETATQAIADVSSELHRTYDSLAQTSQGTAALATRTTTAVMTLHACMDGVQGTYFDLVAQMTGSTSDAVAAAMTPQDYSLTNGRSAFDAIISLTADRRAKVALLKAEVVRQTGHAWSDLRYFSFEEDADDTSVPVLRAAGLPADGLSIAMVTLLDPGDTTRCTEYLANKKTPPYGANLPDDHHATCWRARHIQQFAQATGGSPMARQVPSTILHDDVPVTTPWSALPRPLSERIAY
ncbi:MAG TPA: hypothetical protein VGM90_11105 [Kofleriaceae bacterium]|jgi:hypothetical protein